MRTIRVKDIAKIEKIKPVINLDEVDSIPDELVNTFKFSEDTERVFDAVLGKINAGTGCSFFLKGGRGSGKSHLESYLELMFRRKLMPLEKYEKAKKLDMRIIRISLPAFSGENSFEQILQMHLKDTGPIDNRIPFYAKHFSVPTLIIIDELSDFLSSRQEHEFFEDVRTLQFLGEFSERHPLWIVAALQQSVEEAADQRGFRNAEVMARLKDRFVNLKLSVAHIEDLIDKRVVIKNDEAQEVIKNLYARFRKNYPRIQLKLEEFRKTYPLHPVTARFLTGLESIYSSTRGILQFVSAEAQKCLPKNAEDLDTLITADVIFDHFEDSIRESYEHQRLAKVVYDYYKKHIAEILPKQEHQDAGLAAIKVLILTAISPTEKRKTADDVAEILGKQMGTISPMINYEMIQELIMDPIVAHQMFIKKEGFEYFIDAKIDEGIRTRDKVKTQVAALADRQILFNEICRTVNTQMLPLRDITEQGGKVMSFTWQNSKRDCAAEVFKADMPRKADLERSLNALNGAIDVKLMLFSPFIESKDFYVSIKDTCPHDNLGLLMFWIPRDMTDAELSFVESYVAKTLLVEECPSLALEVKKGDNEFIDTISKIYFEGTIVTAGGSPYSNSEVLKGLPFYKIISVLFDEGLMRIHPKHQQTAPLGDVSYISEQQINSLYAHFIKAGKILQEEAGKRGLDAYIKGLLKPMGLSKIKGNFFEIKLDEDNELVKYVLDFIRIDDSLIGLRNALKKGDWGLSEAQFRLLVSTLISLGQLAGYRDSEPVDLKDIGVISRNEVNRLKSGKGIAVDLSPYIPYGRFIWGETVEIPTPLTQRSMWESAKDYIRSSKKLITELRGYINKNAGSSVLKKLKIDTVLLKRLATFIESQTLSIPAPDGIDRFLVYLRDNNDAEADNAYLKRLHRLFATQFDTITRCYLYLSDPAIKHIDQITGMEMLKEKRDLLNLKVEEFFNSLENFEDLKADWEEFYDEFSAQYINEHAKYYDADAFAVKRAIDDSPEAKLLRKISAAVRSITFAGEWYQMDAEYNKLPDRCHYEVQSDLYLRPQCPCGYKLGSNAPAPGNDLRPNCREGIMNFVKYLQANSSSLESYILSLNDNAVAKKSLVKLMTVNMDKARVSSLMPLLSDDVLAEINKAFKNGGWAVREVDIEELVSSINGRRFKPAELKEVFFKWMGPEEQAVIHVKDRNPSIAAPLREDLSKYGDQGYRLAIEIEREVQERPDLTLEDLHQGGATLHALDRIRLDGYSKGEIFKLLEQETIASLKQKIRDDIFHRAWGNKMTEETYQMATDIPIRDILKICDAYAARQTTEGVQVFVESIAPFTLLYHKLKYENAAGLIVSEDVVSQLGIALAEAELEYAKSPSRFAGAHDEKYLASAIFDQKASKQNIVVVLDGLRYDLWLMLKGVLASEGRNIKEEPYIIPSPTLTNNFRQLIGLGDAENPAAINKKWSMLKWAEKDASLREVKKFLKAGDDDVKILHFNFIDTKIHASALDLYPLYSIIKDEFINGILPVLRELESFTIVSDHGFAMTNNLKERYTHGSDSIWERILPLAKIS